MSHGVFPASIAHRPEQEPPGHFDLIRNYRRPFIQQPLKRLAAVWTRFDPACAFGQCHPQAIWTLRSGSCLNPLDQLGDLVAAGAVSQSIKGSWSEGFADASRSPVDSPWGVMVIWWVPSEIMLRSWRTASP